MIKPKFSVMVTFGLEEGYAVREAGIVRIQLTS